MARLPFSGVARKHATPGCSPRMSRPTTAATTIRVYRALVLEENAVNALIGADAVAVDRRGVAAWPS
jgi:hypothetical protein